MTNVVICDHKVRNLVETVREVLTLYGHQVTEVIDDDPVAIYNAICNLPNNPDVVLTDLAHEPEDLGRSVQDWWGTRLIQQLRGNPHTAGIRIKVRSRYLSPDDTAYLSTLGVNPDDDILSPYCDSLTEIAEKIDK